MEKKLISIYSKLLSEYGFQNWWPADDTFEIIIGTILAQGVSWTNVEISIKNLKDKKLLNPDELYKIDIEKLSNLIKPSRFYNQKAKTIKNFLEFLNQEFENNPLNMIIESTSELRDKILKIEGIGKETTDSILLYALGKPVFVVDSYTKRIFSRYGLIDEFLKYDEIQNLFISNLPLDTLLFNDFHAQVVNFGNRICQKNPRCAICPIKKVDNQLYCSNSK